MFSVYLMGVSVAVVCGSGQLNRIGGVTHVKDRQTVLIVAEADVTSGVSVTVR